MKITLPEKVTGSRDALFVLEVEFPVATAERTVEVETQGPVEPLDLSGSSRGGTYRIPIGLERLHVPMRVLEEGEGKGTITVRCTAGPEEGSSENGAVQLEAPTVKAGGRRGRRWVMAAAAIAVVAAGAWGVTRLTGKDKVPDVRGLSHEVAESRLAAFGLKVDPKYEAPDRAEDEGLVMRTRPAPGQDLPASGMVEIVIGLDKGRLVPLRAYVGEVGEDAEAALRAAGFQVVTLYEDSADPGQAGRVLSQSPAAGASLPRGTRVQLRVGREPEVVEIPSLLGRTAAEAEEALRRLGSRCGVRDRGGRGSLPGRTRAGPRAGRRAAGPPRRHGRSPGGRGLPLGRSGVAAPSGRAAGAADP